MVLGCVLVLSFANSRTQGALVAMAVPVMAEVVDYNHEEERRQADDGDDDGDDEPTTTVTSSKRSSIPWPGQPHLPAAMPAVSGIACPHRGRRS